MKILVLYTRLTGYWMACMREDYSRKKNTYLVFRTPPSTQAPFQIKSEEGIEVCDFSGHNLSTIESKIQQFSPDLIYIAGWTNKFYLKIAKSYKERGIPIITGMDNQWLGTPKQYLATLMSYSVIRKYVTHIWVPGKPQYYFARKLGFKPEHILTGLYCADETIFKTIEQTNHNKQLIFVGRVVEHKGVKILFEVVKKMLEDPNCDLKLHVVGSGPLENLIPQHPNVTHTPFVDPSEIPDLMTNAGTFILPSLYEAWGVVVHEAALAGLPIISTHQCGATTALLIDDFNGYIYDAMDRESLTQIIKKMVEQTPEDYFKMSKNSRHLATSINILDWSAKINSIIN